jgi:hypothetical protein
MNKKEKTKPPSKTAGGGYLTGFKKFRKIEYPVL